MFDFLPINMVSTATGNGCFSQRLYGCHTHYSLQCDIICLPKVHFLQHSMNLEYIPPINKHMSALTKYEMPLVLVSEHIYQHNSRQHGKQLVSVLGELAHKSTGP